MNRKSVNGNMTSDGRSALCRRVMDRLIEGGDVSGDAELGEHLRSCMACYRDLTELRDAPRIAAMLRADASSAGARDDAFWAELATRTADASAVAMARAGKRRPFRVAAVGVVLAAAAAWMLFLWPSGTGRVNVAREDVAPLESVATEMETADEVDVADVAALDETALRALLERLQAGVGDTRALATTATVDEDDVLDDDSELEEVLAELDGPALRRVQRSLAGTTL